jgi:hypothetical protein
MDLIEMKPDYGMAKRRLKAELKMIKRITARREALAKYRRNVKNLRHFAKANLLDLSSIQFID